MPNRGPLFKGMKMVRIHVMVAIIGFREYFMGS